MGWDIHFIKTEKIGKILDEGKGFNVEDLGNGTYYLYVEKKNGDRSGICFNAEGDYRDQFLDYTWANYNMSIIACLYQLYRQFGLLFGELEDYYYLYDYAEDDDELFDLQDYSTCKEMVGWLKDGLEPDDWLYERLRETTPVYERIYQRYKQKHERTS